MPVRSPAIRTTTRSPRSQFCATRTPTAGARAPARRRWSTTNRYVSYGAGGFDPTAFVRVDIKSLPTPDADGQFRQVVRVRPHPDPRDEDRRWHRISRRARYDEHARRLPHAATRLPRKFLNVTAFQPTRTRPPGSAISTRVTARRAARRRSTPMWRIGEYFSNSRRCARGPARLPPIRWIRRRPASASRTTTCWRPTVTGTSRPSPRDQGSRAAIGNYDLTRAGPRCPARSRLHARAALPASLPRGADDDQQHAGRPRDVLLDQRPPSRPSHESTCKDTIAPWQHVTFYGLSLGAEGNSLTLPA